MIAVLGFLVFAGALATSVAVIAAMIAPQWQRVLRLAAGHMEPSFAPLATLAHAERRIAVRRRSVAPVPAPIRLRAAA